MGFDEDNAQQIKSLRFGRGGRTTRDWNTDDFCRILGWDNRAELDQRMAALDEGTVLEIACGEGNALDYLAGQYPDLQFKGVDVYADRNKTTPTQSNVCIEKQDAQSLDIADNSVDVAYSVWGLPHIVDKLRVVRECHRVLKPGGLGILAVKSDYIVLGQAEQQFSPPSESCVKWDEERRALIVRKNGSAEKPLTEYRYQGTLYYDFLVGITSHYFIVGS